MPVLKIRVELNKGREGMPLEKLIARAERLVGFLDNLAKDLSLGGAGPIWVAEEFDNGSVDFDCRLDANLNEDLVDTGRSALDHYFGGVQLDPLIALKIRPGTTAQFRKLTASLDPDERIFISVYNPMGEALGPWRELSATSPAPPDLGPVLGRTYHGEIQGVVAALFKEGKFHMWVRELATDRRIKCFFPMELYPEAIRALNDPESVVFIDGDVVEDPESGEIAVIHAEHIRPAPVFSMETFKQFLGAIPDYTGNLSTLQHLEALRDR